MMIRWRWILFNISFCALSVAVWRDARSGSGSPTVETSQDAGQKNTGSGNKSEVVENDSDDGGKEKVATETGDAGDDQGNVDEAQVNALGIVPESVSIAIGVRNISELTIRGDKFIDESGLNVPIRYSAAFVWLVDFLNIRKGLDQEGAMALMQIPPELDLESLVLAVPVKDFRLMAENLGVPQYRLLSGDVLDRDEHEGTNNMPYVRYIAVRGKHLLLGGMKETVEVAARAPSLKMALPNQLERTLVDDDILLYARQLDASTVNSVIEGVALTIESLGEGAQDETVEQLKSAASDLKSVIAGIRLDGGLGATLSLNFEGEQSKDVLGRIASHANELSLAGLPTGRVLAAHTSRGDGDKSEDIASVLLSILYDQLMAWTDQEMKLRQDSAIVDMFGVGWEHLNGSRTALYENADPRRQGAFSFLAILEADDADAFVEEMAALARFVSVSGLPAEEREEVIDQDEISLLIEELGHGRYRMRQLAAIKLELVGAPALDALKEIQDSRDPETRARARSIIRRIAQAAAQQKKAILEENFFSQIQPVFAFLPDQEKRAGVSVAMLQMQLAGEDTALASQMQALFGPKWRSLRLATVDNQVVILLGSDAEVMDRAISHLQAEKAEMQTGNRFSQFRMRGVPDRTAEFHLSLSRMSQLFGGFGKAASDPPKLGEQGNQKPVDGNATDQPSTMTSFGMSLGPQSIRFDMFAPYEDAKVVVKRFY